MNYQRIRRILAGIFVCLMIVTGLPAAASADEQSDTSEETPQFEETEQAEEAEQHKIRELYRLNHTPLPKCALEVLQEKKEDSDFIFTYLTASCDPTTDAEGKANLSVKGLLTNVEVTDVYVSVWKDTDIENIQTASLMQTEPGNYEGQIQIPAFGTYNVQIVAHLAGDQTKCILSTTTTRSDTPTYGQLYYVDGILIVNKKHSLPEDYAPEEDPVAAYMIHCLIEEMWAEGFDYVSDTYSGYRSYETQTDLYNSYVAAEEQGTVDTYSARPGFSEHQTGLAFDLMDSRYEELLTDEAAADWLLTHAHLYGFIVRYQAGKESITGYMHEPWHLRYLGVETATKVYESGLCLEEYLGILGGDY